MTSSLPWDDITTPNADYNVRLAKNCGHIPSYWGKNSDGKLIFMIALSGDYTSLFIKEKLLLNGIHVDLQQSNSDNIQNMILTLERKVDSDLFYVLCNSLLNNLCTIVLPEDALVLALQHLKRWRAFLKKKNPRLLTAQEYRGLFAELLFLKKLFATKLSKAAAIEAWKGPDDIHQDFIYSGKAVEVKSLSSSDPSTVRIASENQLETTEEQLHLVTFLLTEKDDHEQAKSLNDLVVEISASINDVDTCGCFEDKLAAYGYIHLPNYDSPLLTETSVKAYDVTKEFPKVIRSELPLGVIRVFYQLELDKISCFMCKLDSVLEVA